MSLSNRQLFLEIMFYGAFDRAPVVHWGGWSETLERWRSEGLDPDANIHAILGTTPHVAGVGVDLGLYPPFPEEVFEETTDYRIYRQADGVVCKAWKQRSCIPHYTGFTFKTAADWPEYKKRLQPCPERLPPDLGRMVRDAEASGAPVAVATGSLMGWCRNWMGVEGMSYLLYDDRDCYKDIVDTIVNLVCWGLDQILPKLSRPADLGFGWEDICGRSGPLVSPHIFDECVGPGYLKIRHKLEEHGVFLFSVDCDGDIDQLVGHWLDAGVNVMFPVEVGVWGADAMAYRKRYGRNLRFIGHYDKRVLEKGQDAIVRELHRHLPLLKDGGFMMMPDHLITPGVPFADYRFYLDQLRALRF